MRFDDVRKGQLVRIHPKITTVLKQNSMALGMRWSDESTTCVLYVEDRNVNQIEFSCVTECGSHFNEVVSWEDYADIEERLMVPVLIEASVNEAFQLAIPQEEGYVFDVEKEADHLLNVLSAEIVNRDKAKQK